MEAAGPHHALFAQSSDSHAPVKRLHRLQSRLTKPPWLRPRYVLLALVILLVVWYTGAWRLVYVNLTPGTQGGDAAITITTDHSTYLQDEGLTITITNHLSVSIYAHAWGKGPGFWCDIDVYSERRNASDHWEGYVELGVSAENACQQTGCSGVAPSPNLPPPPPEVMVLAPGASYTHHWLPNGYNGDGPMNDPGTYRLVFRYSTDPYAAGITRLGYPDMPEPGTVGLLSLATATSAPVRVIDDGLRPPPYHCTAP
ncbi:MAG TPA: hypothetical protein VF510_05150 [Ktedonobacterales bacterium]